VGPCALEVTRDLRVVLSSSLRSRIGLTLTLLDIVALLLINLHRSSPSHLYLLSSVTTRVSKLIVATQQVKGKI
jgi:hypothetical protein